MQKFPKCPICSELYTAVAKLQFFNFVASLFTPFLIAYETDWLVLSFMYGDLFDDWKPSATFYEIRCFK